ncbi:hypothetical protein ASG05_01915 [Frigoribacterium sp. Leaf186]|nr:hypothetical protein ASG05_01915 [Frigoribacterium sp. Leaf186]
MVLADAILAELVVQLEPCEELCDDLLQAAGPSVAHVTRMTGCPVISWVGGAAKECDGAGLNSVDRT